MRSVVEDGRLARQVEDHERRLREVENVQSPAQSRALDDLRGLQRKVEDIDLNGAHATRLIMAQQARDIARLETEVAAWEADRKSLRRLGYGALIATAGNLAVAILLRSLPTPGGG